MTAFKKHYCILGGFGGNEILGYKNMNELKARIQKLELRRLKKSAWTYRLKFISTKFWICPQLNGVSIMKF